MTGIEARFRHRFGVFQLDVALDLPGSGVISLFGPSGSGKSSVLRCIAGLVRPVDGLFRINGDVWQNGARVLPPHRRRVGYVFQHANLFPHLTVAGNLRYGLKRAGSVDRKIGYDEIVAMLRLESLLDRAPGHLSGGECQRVAIGRALLAQPRLLLLDEPLAGLDAGRKREILPYLEALRTRLNIPVIHVSHDLSEVVRLADHLALIEAGRIEAAGPLAAVMSRLDLPLALSPEAGTVLTGRLAGFDTAYGLGLLDVGGGRLHIPGLEAAFGRDLRVHIIATDVALSRTRPADTTFLNILSATIAAVEPAEAQQVNVLLRLGDGSGAPLMARVTRKSWDGLRLQRGDAVFALIKAASLAEPAGS